MTQDFLAGQLEGTVAPIADGLGGLERSARPFSELHAA